LSIVNVQAFLLNILDGLSMPYGQPAAEAFITPPDPRRKASVPAIYVWPADGNENRSGTLGGTLPRNTGPNTASGTKGIMHQVDVYLTWFGQSKGRQSDPVFPAMVDAVMYALRFSAPNPATMKDPNTGEVTDVYNVGEDMHYRTGLEATEDERILRYDCLVTCSVWENFRA
jgi:hypothetical protein